MEEEGVKRIEEGKYRMKPSNPNLSLKRDFSSVSLPEESRRVMQQDGVKAGVRSWGHFSITLSQARLAATMGVWGANWCLYRGCECLLLLWGGHAGVRKDGGGEGWGVLPGGVDSRLLRVGWRQGRFRGGVGCRVKVKEGAGCKFKVRGSVECRFKVKEGAGCRFKVRGSVGCRFKVKKGAGGRIR